MKRKIILLALFTYFTALASAQAPELPSQVKAKLPGILATNKPQMMETLLQEFRNGSGWGQDKRAKPALWVVYSDREQNPTYTTPNKAKRFGELKFGEKVCIADIKGDMALIYSDDRARYPEIPSNIKSKGWIPMENLLL